jgi:hypothetical protein
MKTRVYRQEDQQRILAIFRSNCPKYFAFDDEQYLIDFLNNYADENYLVMLKGEEIIGCGGHYTKDDMHGIAWVMFEAGSIGSGHLKQISDDFYTEIESKIITESSDLPIRINTTQLMEKWFNRYGFKTYEITKDGFGKGLDEYKMIKSRV